MNFYVKVRLEAIKFDKIDKVSNKIKVKIHCSALRRFFLGKQDSLEFYRNSTEFEFL